MLKFVLIFAGGGLGSVLRYAVYLGVERFRAADSPGFPFGTLIVNVSGCLAIGVLAALFAHGPMSKWPFEWQVACTIGVLGGFTTFSSFGLDAIRLVQTGQTGAAVVYVLTSNGLGLVAAWGGWVLGRSIA